MRRPRCWERLKAKGEGGDRVRWLDGITDSVDVNSGELSRQPRAGGLGVLQSVKLLRVGHLQQQMDISP